MNVRERYEGIQTILKVCGEEGCHFLTLLTIIEDVNGKPVDLIEAIRVCLAKGWIDETFWVTNDGTPILSYWTNKKWTRKEVEKLPVIRDNDYTEAKYYNKRTNLHHFRRRGYDILSNSITVKEGRIISYYIYTWSN